MEDKVFIYERLVFGSFLDPANEVLVQENGGFIVLMICMSYLEGVEQYRMGKSSNGQSEVFFVNVVHRLYSKLYSSKQLRLLYKEARCGLFHNGMVQGKIIMKSSYSPSLTFSPDDTR